jgi:amino acid transporter
MSFLRRILGKPRDLRDPHVFQHVSLIAFFAWVGLGADGLSSSAYGPEEAFRNLEGHTYLAVFVAIAMAATVFTISYAYSRIIEAFPHGGGGYLVASKLLGPGAGVISGCALLVDYVLTITVSIVGGANAIFAFLPPEWAGAKLTASAVVIALLLLMNLRGVKESVVVLTPIFIVFLITHLVLIVGTLVLSAGRAGEVVNHVQTQLHNDVKTMGGFALLLLFMRAYALGGSAYTGIEAVSNGLSIMRAPQVETGKRTMIYMASSLAFTAGGIVLAYLLMHTPVKDSEPMNATLATQFAGSWHVGGIAVGKGFVILTMVAEGALLFVAAQAGFIDGPRVMANMALDSWMPHRFAALSEHLTMRNGVYLMGGAALATLFYTHGDVHTLIIMYSINVFLTFSLSNLGMCRHWWRSRRIDPAWRSHFVVHLVGFGLCAMILAVTVFEKFLVGGWITLVATIAIVALCWMVRRHYRMVGKRIASLNAELKQQLALGLEHKPVPASAAPMDPSRPTAVLLVGSYSGLGVQTLLEIERIFPGHYDQVMFLSAGVIDSGAFKGAETVEALEKSIASDLRSYVTFARERMGWVADSTMAVGTEAVSEIERLCREVHLMFPRAVFFAGNLIFREPTWWQRVLHNETAHAVQRRLEFDRLPMVVVPVRVLK